MTKVSVKTEGSGSRLLPPATTYLPPHTDREARGGIIEAYLVFRNTGDNNLPLLLLVVRSLFGRKKTAGWARILYYYGCTFSTDPRTAHRRGNNLIICLSVTVFSLFLTRLLM